MADDTMYEVVRFHQVIYRDAGRVESPDRISVVPVGEPKPTNSVFGAGDSYPYGALPTVRRDLLKDRPDIDLSNLIPRGAQPLPWGVEGIEYVAVTPAEMSALQGTKAEVFAA